MTDFEDQPPPAVGAYWIKEEDYPALLKIFDDGSKMPRTWKEWVRIAEGTRTQGLRACRYACSDRPEDISRLVRRPWHEPGS
jgi:hypothetical protein